MMEALSQRLFALLLWLYPADLRREFGPEMLHAFRDQIRDRRRRGRVLGVALAWTSAGADLGRTALLARRDRRQAARRVRRGGDGAASYHPAPPGNHMDAFISDIRLGIRNFVKNPGFALAATATLAIGVGASVTMFSGLSNFVLDPLPFGNQDELYSVYSVMPARGSASVSPSYADYLDLRDSGAFDDSAAWYGAGYNLTGTDTPVRVNTLRAGANLFPTLGVEAERGRVFNRDEDRSDARVVVISDAFWQRQFGADPSAVGSVIRLDGDPYTIVGVMPAGFWYPTPQYDAWVPLDLEPSTLPRDARFLGVVARVRDGALDEARARLNVVAARLEETEPDTNAGVSAARLAPLSSEIIWDEMRMSLYMLTITGMLVLLIACVNVANLLVAKGMSRRRELAVRAALGASRLRLVRQYLAENIVLGIAGGGLGLIIARLGISGIGAALSANEPGRVPRLPEYLESGLDGRVLAFTLLASVGAVLLFALLPALHGTRGGLHDGLQEGGRGGLGTRSRRLQKSLVVFEMALTLALLVGAGLTLRSYAVVLQTDPGMRTEGLLTMSVALTESRYDGDGAATSFLDEALDGFRSIPAVRGASATSSLPHARQDAFRVFEIEGRPAVDRSDYPRVNQATVDEDYFVTLGATIARGRSLGPADDAGAPHVAVINQTFATRFWGDEDPLGARIRRVPVGDDTPWIEIVGVVSDFRNNGLHRPTWPAIYLPMAQQPVRQLTLLVRSDEDPLTLTAQARAVLAEIDPDLPIFRVMTMEQVLANRFWGETLTMKLLTWCALGALLLAIVGIYGVISYSVNQRTHEMGVRIALGARAGDVVSLVVRQGLWLAAFGIVFGLLLGFGLSRGLSFMLFGVSGNDPVTYGFVVMLLALVAAAASYVPARRATTVDPIVALRNE